MNPILVTNGKPKSKEECLLTVLISDSKASRATVRSYVKRYDLVPYRCRCGNAGEWLGKRLALQLHHRNGEPTDQSLGNLEFLCPNCHAQEPNTNRAKSPPRPVEKDILAAFGASLNMRDLIRRIGMIDNGANYRIIRRVLRAHGLSFKKKTPVPYSQIREEAETKHRETKVRNRKVVRPCASELKRLIWEKPLTTIAAEYGVTGTAIAKWCEVYQIARPGRGYWAKRQCGLTHEEALLPPAPRGPRSERRLSESQVAQLLMDRMGGVKSKRALAISYGICCRTVERICQNGGYKPRMTPPAGLEPALIPGRNGFDYPVADEGEGG